MQDDAAEPIWLSAAEIVQINRRVLAKSGERHFLRSADLLDGAVSRPRNAFEYAQERDVFALASVVVVAVGQSHCFEQGNKRTAFHAGLQFLAVNNVFLALPDTDETAALIEDAILGKRNTDDLAERFRRWAY